MIQPASKYQSLRGLPRRPAPSPSFQTSGRSTGQGRTPIQRGGTPPLSSGKTARVALPVFKRQRGPGGLNVFIPTLKAVTIRWDEWMDKALREGGFLERYMARERHTGQRRQRAVARKMQGFKQNMKSDFELKAAVPAREFFRWKQEDPDFWLDDKNLKSLKRDGAEFPIFV